MRAREVRRARAHISAQDLWILEYQILPNLYALKYSALSNVIAALKAARGRS